MFDSETVISESIDTILWQAGEMLDSDDVGTGGTWYGRHDADSAHITTEYQILADFYGFLTRVKLEDVTEYLEVRSTGDFIHDYWLTRNGHGAGFWDRGLEEAGERLALLAQDEGGYDVWDSMDGKGHVNGYIGWFYE